MRANCMAMDIKFIAIGDELLLGETQESNGTYLSKELDLRGLGLNHSQILPDRVELIADTIKNMSVDGGLIVISGGLGPTDDDLTREAVAMALGVSLECHEDIREALANRKSSLNSKISKSNLRQAFAPSGAKIMPNKFGTAPSFVAKLGTCSIFCLPGVPREFKALINLYLDDLLAELGAKIQHRSEVLLKIFGESESALQDRMLRIPNYEAVQIRSLPKFPEIWLKLRPTGSQEDFDEYIKSLAQELDWRVFGNSVEGTYPDAVVNDLKAAGASLSLAESCTGGLIAHMVTSVPGSSSVFWGGAVTYANEAKEKMLGVPSELIAQHGAVSAEVVVALAEGLRREYGTVLGLSVTGIAGPGGGTESKPVGTVHIGLSSPEGTDSWIFNFPDLGRSRIQTLTAYIALGKIRSWLARHRNNS
jgi:nicotinamide-nucleotide amidase